MAKYEQKQGEFLEDGAYRCPICRAPVSFINALNGELYRQDCECDKAAAAEQAAMEKKKKADERRVNAFGNPYSKRLGFTFETDDQRNSQASAILKEYCNNFEKHRKNGEGFLIHSPATGGGKSFLAAAVANRLIDDGYTVMVTDFMALRDRLYNPTAYKFVNKEDFLCRLRSLDFIVIDDLGAGQSSEFALEVEYRVIDTLTDSKVPLIVTTNATLTEIAKETDISKKRVLDRIMGSCRLLNVEPPEGRSRRVEACERLTKGM